MKSSLSWRYLVPFLSLVMLCGTSHEFAHHFTGAMICGCFGTKTFNSFQLCLGCEASRSYWILATYAGPIFTFALLWIGWYQLRSHDPMKKQLGFALIFANFPINRILFALLRYNDEQYAASVLFGESEIAFWLTNMVIWALTFPPLWMAYKSIESPNSLLWFLGFFVLPFIFVILFAGLFLENWLLLEKQFLSSSVFGIPYLLLVVEIGCLITYLRTKKYLYLNPVVMLTRRKSKSFENAPIAHPE